MEVIKNWKKYLRRAVYSVLTVVLAINWILGLVLVAIKSTCFKIIGIESYWDLDNEWFQVKQEIDYWRNNWG